MQERDNEDGWSKPTLARFERQMPRWWPAVSWVLAVVLFTLAVSLLLATAGVGGLAAGLVVAFGLTWAKAWRREVRLRRQLRIALAGITLVGAIWDGYSFVRYVTTYNGDSLSQRASTWGRDHGLSPIIDWLESNVYDEPPSRAPAEELSLAVTTTTAPPTPSTEPTDTTDLVTTTTIFRPPAPAPLATRFDPPLAGEGQWIPVAQASGTDAMWATSVRPLADYGGVVASVVVIDQTYLRAGLFNGNEQPRGDWQRDDHVPAELIPALTAAMNGGFRLEHSYGGYVTEGVVVQELVPGRATIGIDREGKITIGELGRDLFDDGSWLTLRQNIILMVDGGQSQVARSRQARVTWGAHATGDLFVNRSALCMLTDGRLAYVMAGKVNPTQMAEVLIGIGCDKAIQLDINAQWPNFTVFPHAADGTVVPFAVDRRMNSDGMRYIKRASKEFFAFFDATLVPAASVLDA